MYGPPLNSHCSSLAGSGDRADLHQTWLGFSEGRQWRRARLLRSSACARWSFQPLSESKDLIDHYGDSQQHQHHGDGGTHSSIIPVGWWVESHVTATMVSDDCPRGIPTARFSSEPQPTP